MLEAIRRAGYEPGADIALALDAASTEFLADGSYYPESKDTPYTTAQRVDFYTRIGEAYPVISIEDGGAEDDWMVGAL